MNTTSLYLTSTVVTLFALSFNLNAATLTWDGDEGDGLLTSANNWNTDTAPQTGDILNISNGDTVSHENFMPGGLTINLTGNSSLSTVTAVIRPISTINVGSGSSLLGAFWDLNSASVTFNDGAIASMAGWELKGPNTFKYVLGATGFTTLTPTNLYVNGDNTTQLSDDNFVVDFSSFNQGPGDYSISLMDFTTDGNNLLDSEFQAATFTYLGTTLGNGNTITDQALYWDPTDDSINLDFTVVPEPSIFSLFSGLGALVCLALRRR